MFAASSKETSPNGPSQFHDKELKRPGFKMKVKVLPSELTLPPISSEPLCFTAASVSRTPISESTSDRNVSEVKLPQLSVQGPEREVRRQTGGPQMMTSSFATANSIRETLSSFRYFSLPETGTSIQKLKCEDKNTMRGKDWKGQRSKKVTGTDVVEIFTQNRDFGPEEFYYLKAVDGDTYRPYDLEVVNSWQAGDEHYIFFPTSVQHVTKTRCGRVVSLAEWHKEYLAWTALQKIPFFRDFRLWRTFTLWHKDTRKSIFQSRCKDLEKMLLIAVPQFRDAFHLFNTLIEELKETHWMPLNDSQSHTLMELKNVLSTKRQECLGILDKLLHCRNVILQTVKADSYKRHQELQLHLKLTENSNRVHEPIHLLWAHQRELKKELVQSEGVLQKLGHFAALIHHMLVQSLNTTIQQDSTSFLSLLQRLKSEQCCLFHTELCFNTVNELTVEPPVNLFQEAVSEALRSVGSSVVQKCDECGLFLEISNIEISSPQDVVCDINCLKLSVTKGEKCDTMIHGLLGDKSVHLLSPPKETFEMVKGNVMQGCYSPLSKTQLEWHITVNDVTKQVEEEQTKIVQEAQREIHELCESLSWLVEIHVFIGQWSEASLEAMKGQPALEYEEHIKKVRSWAERISTLKLSVSTTSKVFLIHCTQIKETLDQQLKWIDEEVLLHLAEQTKLHTENIISDLDRASAELNTEPKDIKCFAKYALRVRDLDNMIADTQKHLEYINSLKNTISTNYRRMTDQELTLEEKMRDMWDCFIPLSKQAESLFYQRRPSVAKALDTMHSFLMRDLKSVVSSAKSETFVDPRQNSKEMLSKLSYMCAHLQSLSAKLEDLEWTNQAIGEYPMDSSILTADIPKIAARKDLWELKVMCSTWLEEWQHLCLSEIVVSQAQEKILIWKEQVQSLTHSIPTHDPVLQDTLGVLERLTHQLIHMAKLQNPTLIDKHWKALFQDMGLPYFSAGKVSVADLMSTDLEIHQKTIDKICRDAQMEYSMKEAFQKLCQGWENRSLQVYKFILPGRWPSEPQSQCAEKQKTKEVRSIAPCCSPHPCDNDLKRQFAEIEHDLMTLSIMLKSPYSVEFKLHAEMLVQSLQELGKLLDLFERCQQVWAFLSKVFGKGSLNDHRVDLLKKFQPVDKKFKEVMFFISTEPHLLNVVSTKTNTRFHGKPHGNLYQILFEGLSTMESIFNQMVDVLDGFCKQFPRLRFLSDREVMQLFSLCPTPLTLQPFVQKCFKGVRQLEVDRKPHSTSQNIHNCDTTSQTHEQMTVRGVFGSLQEYLSFQAPVEPNPDALQWFCVFEKQLKLTMVQLIKQCAGEQNQLEIYCQDLAHHNTVGNSQDPVIGRSHQAQTIVALLSKYPLQCVLVAEEAGWSIFVQQAFQDARQVNLSKVKAHISAKLTDLVNSIRNRVTGSKSDYLASRYTMMCLHALVQLTMHHEQQLSCLMEVQCPLESSFEWLSMMKYHVNPGHLSLTGIEDNTTCYIDVLGNHLKYGFEYSGPEDLVMVHTPSSERARLGILFALTNYKCGFVCGSQMTGKKTTAIQLGKALGRQVVITQCYPDMRLGVFQQMLLGALQTGAWLLLDSVDLLTQGVLSVLGQFFSDIHLYFSKLRGKWNQCLNKEREEKLPQQGTAYGAISDPVYQIKFAGKAFSASSNYGCVLISSKCHPSRIPENLRMASRPVAFTSPDHRIFAEVMLTAVGFSEAISLSQRLVSLISLAKESGSLPHFFCDDQSCFLGILQKIIYASEIHLQQMEKQQHSSNEAKGLTDMSLQNTPQHLYEKDKEETEKLSTSYKSYLLVQRILLEETAIVKAIISTLMSEHKKALQFYNLFKDTFPTVCQFPFFQHYIEETEKTQLQNAVTQELQQKHLHYDSELVCSALTLHQALKVSQTVILIGPSGSGKTTCYSALAEAFNSLIAKKREYDLKNEKKNSGYFPQANPQNTVSNCSFVSTLVLFPNAMSHDEMFGCFCEERGWQDGAVAKVLRDSERHKHVNTKFCNNQITSDETPRVTWLIMDGEPVMHPGWLDYLTTLCNSKNPISNLPSAETWVPQSNLKLISEMTDLRDASPSVVTHCSLIYFTGTDLWKAVWKSEMESLSFEHQLDQKIVTMWNFLAEDLFSNTLGLFGPKGFTLAIQTERGAFENLTCGLQEIMSFARILQALLLHFGKEVEKPEATRQINNQDGTTLPSTTAQSKQLLGRDIFLLAYIWGFGGHLHPRHWPQFDMLVRQLLLTCRYEIEVPEEKSVFGHFFSIDSKVYPKNTSLTSSVIPKYEKYNYLLKVMLNANQPVLLVGEPASGKTTLCKTLLTFEKPHYTLSASPQLNCRDIRAVLNGICDQKNCKNALYSKRKHSGLLLFVDDLHEAPGDVFEKASMALETLRQSISKKEIRIFDNNQFKLLKSETISYMATSNGSEPNVQHSNMISARLSRLFSIFVLPNLSIDFIFSIHSPYLKICLKGLSLGNSGKNMSNSIITATESLYHAVCGHFQPTMQKPHLIFSYNDLQKVFRGMCLHQSEISNIQEQESSLSGFPSAQSGPPTAVIAIVHLWIHECMRTFSDRLCSEDDKKTLLSFVAKTAITHFGIGLIDEIPSNCVECQLPAMSLTTHPLHAGTEYLPKRQYLKTVNLPLEENSADKPDLNKDQTSAEPSKNIPSEDPSPKTNNNTLEQLEIMMSKIVYGPKLSEALKTINHQCTFENICYQKQELDSIVQKLCEFMYRNEDDEGENIDEDHSLAAKYMVHREGVSQLVHILRALLIPGGHGVLIGSGKGTGRKTTVRLAAYLTGYKLIEVHAGNEHKLHGILQEAGNHIRADNVKVLILAHDDISQPAREELLVAMAQETYPALHTDHQLRKLVSRAAAVNTSRRCLRRWQSKKYLSQAYKKVHVFLLMPHSMSNRNEAPPSNMNQNGTAQMAKALKLGCCVEVYQPWSHQSLVEVAAQGLRFYSHPSVGEWSAVSLSVAMARIHESACQYASVLLNSQPFSPRTYSEFIDHFRYFNKNLHQHLEEKNNRVSTALCHVDVIGNTVVQSKEHLLTQQKKMDEAVQHEQKLFCAIADQKKLFEKASEKCKVLKSKLQHLEGQIADAQELEKPALLSSLKILRCLNPSDLEEVRLYRDPPERVVKIMDAICLLFHRPPGWESAKQLIGKPNFFQDLEFFDHHSLTKEQQQQLHQMIQSPYFVPETVQETSKACESLCLWVQAVYECCCVQQRMLSKQRLEKQAGKTQNQLNLARQHKKETHDRLKAIVAELSLVQTNLDEFQQQFLEKAKTKEKEVSASAEQLENHLSDRKAVAQETELRHQNSPGDALILAAVISYLAPFGPDVRKELLSKWKELCRTGNINTMPKDSRTLLFAHSSTETLSPCLGFPIPVTEELQLPFSQALGIKEWQAEDTLSDRLVVKLLLWGYRSFPVQRWPLLADTQQHLEAGSRNWVLKEEKVELHTETECEMVISADDPKLLNKLDQAAHTGLRVLVTHVERATPSPEFLSVLARPAGCCIPGIKQPPQMVHPNFCLFLSTHLPARLLSREIHPSILAQVHVVDLCLSSAEIQELMLTQLLQPECRELLIQHSRLQNYNQLLQEKLFTEKEALMDSILHSNTELQEDPGFLAHVAVCQEAIVKLQGEVEQVKEELGEHESLLATPRQVARLAASLYQVLQEVSCLSPAYYFSLSGFIAMMQETATGKVSTLVSYLSQRRTRSLISLITNKMVIQMLVKYGPCLFQSHVAVLKLLVSLAVLRQNEFCSEAEKSAFLRSFEDIDPPVITKKTCSSSSTISQINTALPGWISPHTHSELFCLEKIPSFSGLIASLCSSPMQWQEYLHVPSSTVVGTVPCRSHSHLSLLQRALLWKAVLPDSLELVADGINACVLCLPSTLGGAETPCIRNPEALEKCLVKHEGPIVLALPNPTEDYPLSIQPLSLINQLVPFVSEANEVEVKVISFGEICYRQPILSLLNKAMNDGHWLVFNNCHLLEQWDDDVLAKLNQLIFNSKEEKCSVHPGFRLWFITQENVTHSIPVAVQLTALTVVCDSSWDLKEELSSSLRLLTSVSQHEAVTSEDTDLLLRCAIFHSVLVQRQVYKGLGQGRVCYWNQEDLLDLVDAHMSIATLCQDKANVLQSIAVHLVHGGHVLDSADLEVVENMAKVCFNTVSHLPDSGPHTLSKIISNSNLSDLSGWMQVVEHVLRESTVSDPVLLGLSMQVEAEITKINSRNLNTLMQASQHPPGAGRSLITKLNQHATVTACSHARDKLQALRSFLAQKNDSRVRNAGAGSHSPMRDFLLAEWDELIDSVSSLLSRLQQPVQYTPTFSSFLKLADLSRLERRAELLSAYLWQHSSSDPPGAYRLSAFKNARGFLVALMRGAAEVNHKYISEIALHFEVLCENSCNPPHLLNAAYLCGLELKGALWDSQLGALQEEIPSQSCSLPLLSVKAVVRSTRTAQDTVSCTSSYLKDPGIVQLVNTSPSTSPPLPVYYCPLYLSKGPEGENSELADVNMITKVPFHSRLSPVLCSLRRVRLVSTL